MSTQTSPRRGQPPAFGPGRMLMGMGAPPAKPLNFRESARRLLRMLRPERWTIMTVLVLALAGVVLSVLGPWLLRLFVASGLARVLRVPAIRRVMSRLLRSGSIGSTCIGK